MSAIAASLWARLGNCMHVWAHAKKRAENEGHELRTAEWVGEKIFTLDGHPCGRPDGSEIETLSGYFQAQRDLIYSRADCRRWFKLKPEVERALEAAQEAAQRWRNGETLAHRRVGDYPGHNYPIVSKASYERAVTKFGIQGRLQNITWVTEENPWRVVGFDGDMSMVPDLFEMMNADILLRGNSTFSWWAHVAAPHDQRIFSPVVDGLGGGEHDVEFVEGNWPKCADGLEFVTDLHLKEA